MQQESRGAIKSTHLESLITPLTIRWMVVAYLLPLRSSTTACGKSLSTALYLQYIGPAKRIKEVNGLFGTPILPHQGPRQSTGWSWGSLCSTLDLRRAEGCLSLFGHASLVSAGSFPLQS